MSAIDTSLLDAERVLGVHRAWFRRTSEERTPASIEARRDDWVAGNQADPIMFNFNGSEYESIDDLVQLWSSFGGKFVTLGCRDLVEPAVTVEGDVAWLTCGACEIEARALGEETGDLRYLKGWSPEEAEPRVIRFRATEIYRRDDGAGNADWRIWHAHYSECAAG